MARSEAVACVDQPRARPYTSAHRTECTLVIGLATVSLQLQAAASLKDKRSVTRQLVARVRSRFNVAVAEVDDHDLWGTATLGIVCISTEGAHARSMLESVVEYIETTRLDADLFNVRIELI